MDSQSSLAPGINVRLTGQYGCDDFKGSRMDGCSGFEWGLIMDPDSGENHVDAVNFVILVIWSMPRLFHYLGDVVCASLARFDLESPCSEFSYENTPALAPWFPQWLAGLATAESWKLEVD